MALRACPGLTSPGTRQPLLHLNASKWARPRQRRAGRGGMPISRDNGSPRTLGGPITKDGRPDYSRAAAWSAWSPDGSKIIIRRFDPRKVHQIPPVDFTKALGTFEWVGYAKAGEARRPTGRAGDGPTGRAQAALALGFIGAGPSSRSPGRDPGRPLWTAEVRAWSC
jgi:hypothetical protein